MFEVKLRICRCLFMAETSLLKQYVAGERVDLLEDFL